MDASSDIILYHIPLVTEDILIKGTVLALLEDEYLRAWAVENNYSAVGKVTLTNIKEFGIGFRKAQSGTGLAHAATEQLRVENTGDKFRRHVKVLTTDDGRREEVTSTEGSGQREAIGQTRASNLIEELTDDQRISTILPTEFLTQKTLPKLGL